MADGITKAQLRKEIAAILRDADLTTTSTKKVRAELEEKFDGVDLTSRKREIDEIVLDILARKKDDDENADDDGDEEDDEENGSADSDSDSGRRGQKRSSAGKRRGGDSDGSESESGGGGSEDDYSPGGKMAKKAKTLKGPGRGPKGGKGRKKKKSAGSSGSEQDDSSDEDWKDNTPAPPTTPKGKKAGGAGGSGRGYTRQLQLSADLAELLGRETAARHEVVKAVWDRIKERNMYDPKNRQYAICDDAMAKVMGRRRFRTFSMMKYLKHHFIN